MQPSPKFASPVMQTSVNAIESLYATAHWLHGEGRFRDAMVAFRAMLSLAPKDERGWVGLGTCHERLEQERIALELYSMGCVSAHPAPRCELARARILNSMGREDDAEAGLERAHLSAERAGEDDLLKVIEQEQRRTA